jgi:hypothetical protein
MMVGTFAVAGNLSMSNLAATLTRNEADFTRLTALEVDTRPGSSQNMATFENEDDQLGQLGIVARGAASPGTKILSPTVFINNTKTDIDVYRLALADPG